MGFCYLNYIIKLSMKGRIENMVKLTIDDMRRLASDKGGWCLSEEYINQLTKLTWKCSEGHIWGTIPKHIRKGTWCPICSRKKENRYFHKDVTIEMLKQKAEEKSGHCLSDKYINQVTKLNFQCKEGHIFEATPSSILRGTWCPHCAGKHKYSIEKMQEIAKERGGKCLSLTYKSIHSKLLWECANGHQFQTIPRHVMNGHWCPNCTIYLNEQLCRYILESLFEDKFIKDRNVLNGYELDGYNAKLKLAFEYHGKQHFEQVDFFYSRGDMTLSERKERDRLKEELCGELGIELLIIPYTVEPKSFVSFIIEELTKRGYEFKVNPNGINFDNYYPSKSELSEIQDLAELKKGKCLSTIYINIDSKMDFICKKGHRFSITPYYLKMGQWCRKCSYETRGDLYRLDTSEMYRIAKEKGWECLSKEYKNARTKLKWKCEYGHIFDRNLSHIKEGRGCPICKKR